LAPGRILVRFSVQGVYSRKLQVYLHRILY